MVPGHHPLTRTETTLVTNPVHRSPRGGTLLYAMEPEPLEAAYQSLDGDKLHSMAYHSTDEGGELYYIDSGATGHYIDNVYALHDYTPFDAPRVIRTAADHQVEALGSGTLKFTASVYVIDIA